MPVATMASISLSLPADGRLTPSRIRIARERRGMSKVALAAQLGITTRMLQVYESDGAPAARRDALAAALGVLPSFLERSEIHAVSAEQGFFRARRRATAAQLTSARAVARIGAEFYEWIADRFRMPLVAMPDLDRQEPESAAASLRSLWGRGSEPLPNLIQLSEAHGVRVLSLPVDAETVDAFSVWLDDAPYVFLSTSKTAERSRFDLAHELGHLAMHSRNSVDSGSRGPEEEREADAFASALLMPRDDIHARCRREPAVPEILQLRSYYRVSAMAATRRLHEVGRLTDWGYRQNCVQLAQRGFRSSEPGGIRRELSRVFATVFPLLRDQGIRTKDICADLGLEAPELHSLVFGQLTAGIDGLGTQPGGRPAALRVV